jgi:hypothetical protein
MRATSIMTSAGCVLIGLMVLGGTLLAVAAPAGDPAVSMKDDGKKVVVQVDGQPFTEYVYTGYAKPILYPVIGPTGAAMTRNWPMKEGVKSEATDHVHHKSLWFCHGNVNGVDFWSEAKNHGTIVQDGVANVGVDNGRGVIVTANKWVGPDGKVQCTDKRTMRFFGTADVRTIDFEITIIASEGDVTFGDTKEGSMAIRTCPPLRLTDDKKVKMKVAKGNSVNSEGVKGKAMWGKRAKWVDYWAPIEGEVAGVAIFDHPKNPRHPTWWHARHYGLVSANPFGIHDFEKKGKGAGDMKIKAGQKVTFRYRFLFHKGDAKAADIAKRYDEYAAGK